MVKFGLPRGQKLVKIVKHFGFCMIKPMFLDQSISNFTDDILILTIVFIQLPGAAEGCLAFSDRLVNFI